MRGLASCYRAVVMHGETLIPCRHDDQLLRNASRTSLPLHAPHIPPIGCPFQIRSNGNAASSRYLCCGAMIIVCLSGSPLQSSFGTWYVIVGPYELSTLRPTVYLALPRHEKHDARPPVGVTYQVDRHCAPPRRWPADRTREFEVVGNTGPAW